LSSTAVSFPTLQELARHAGVAFERIAESVAANFSIRELDLGG